MVCTCVFRRTEDRRLSTQKTRVIFSFGSASARFHRTHNLINEDIIRPLIELIVVQTPSVRFRYGINTLSLRLSYL